MKTAEKTLEDIIVFDKLKEDSFISKGEDLKGCKPDKVTIFKAGDEVMFLGYDHIEGKSGVLKEGKIERVGWSVGTSRSYAVCGVKVKGEKFGTALLYNYTVHPIQMLNKTRQNVKIQNFADGEPRARVKKRGVFLLVEKENLKKGDMILLGKDDATTGEEVVTKFLGIENNLISVAGWGINSANVYVLQWEINLEKNKK